MRIARGTFKIIRTDGSEEIVQEKPTLKRVLAIIGCDCIDTVNFGNDTVMMVDDEGLLKKDYAANQKATQLMKERFGPNYPNPIAGIVVLVNDKDFP